MFEEMQTLDIAAITLISTSLALTAYFAFKMLRARLRSHYIIYADQFIINSVFFTLSMFIYWVYRKFVEDAPLTTASYIYLLMQAVFLFMLTRLYKQVKGLKNK